MNSSCRKNSQQSFSRTSRLLLAGEFNAVFAQRKARRGRYFTVHHMLPRAVVLSTEEIVAGNLESTSLANTKRPVIKARIGIVVPKKLLRDAVHRNLIKRLVRESFRQKAGTLKPYDLVVRLNCKLDPHREKIDRKAVFADIDRLLSNFTSRSSSAVVESTG